MFQLGILFHDFVQKNNILKMKNIFSLLVQNAKDKKCKTAVQSLYFKSLKVKSLACWLAYFDS